MADIWGRIVEPFVKRNNWSKKQQSQHYKRLYNIFDRQQDKFGKQNIPSASDMEDVTTVSSSDFQQQVGYWNRYVYQTERDKISRLSTWREMSLFPEISFALNEIVDEAIDFKDDGDFIEMIITNPRLATNENIQRNLVKEWNYILKDVIEGQKYVQQWFLEFMIDGEFFLEKIVDPTTAKDRGIVGVKRLRPEFTYPIWEEIESDDVNQYVHKRHGNILIMPPQMVAYANSGIYDYPDEETKIVVSYLEDSKIAYRKLKQLEDALVIYRLVRAPERRVFNVDVGNLPKAKAESVMQDLIRKYRQRKTYSPATGETSEIVDTMAMIEDFFFPKFSGGRGHSVDTLPGGENLGEIGDILYFLDKLYRALKIPMTRMKSDTGFSLGDTSDITREEVRFNKNVQKYVRRFADVFKSIYLSHLRLKGYSNEYGINEKDFVIKFHQSNLFQEFLETNVFTNRAENFERFVPFAEVGEDGTKPLFSKRWLMKRFLKLSDEEILENEDYIKEDEETRVVTGGDEGLDLDLGGGDFGGEDFNLGGGDEETGDLGGLDDLEPGDLGGDSADDEDSFA